jgi:putative CocE/NonD family hydrolase
MIGISWGGFNALQVAALAPPQLKAIITLCSTDDRYADDAHYMGGCLLNENMQWGSILMAYTALPPDPAIVGDRWREMWMRRIDHLKPFPAVWMEHQWRDDYWKHGSVCEDHAAIKCPVYAIGGWADGYSNAIPRLMAGLECPRKGLIGPWAHVFPHDGVPGPAIGFLQEAVRWWDHWLRGVDSGMMDEPMLRVWMQESVPPQSFYDERPGRWIAEECWPSAGIVDRRFHLNPGRLDPEPAPAVEISFRSPQTTGLRAGEWCAFGAEGEMPLDQRPDDGRSLTFDTGPLPRRLEILGAPIVRLEVIVDKPDALVAVRLNDVAPDGASTQVTYGLLNLAHHRGHDRPEPLRPGQRTAATVKLNDIAHAFPAGHCIRLAISTSNWPIAWPSPENVTLTLSTGNSTLSLPERPPSASDEKAWPFGRPEAAPSIEPKKLRLFPLKRTVENDRTTNETIYTLESDAGEFGGASLARIEAIDMDAGYRLRRQHRIRETDPLSASTELSQEVVLRRSEWSVRVAVRTRLTSTRDHFRFEGELQAFEGGETVSERRWDLDIPRALV